MNKYSILADRLWQIIEEEQAAQGSLDWGDKDRKFKGLVDEFLTKIDTPNLASFLNFFALDVAESFQSKERSFEQCDAAINVVYSSALFIDRDGYTYPALFDRVYDAFDAGEHNHFGKSEFPVEDFTIPLINKILSEYQK